MEECLAELKDRRDAALDFSPDELADIVGAQDQVESGTDTVRLDDDMVSELLSGLSESERQILSGDDHDAFVPQTSAPHKEAVEETVTNGPPDTLREDDESVDPPTEPMAAGSKKPASHVETVELPDHDESTNGARWPLMAILGAVVIAAAAFHLVANT